MPVAFIYLLSSWILQITLLVSVKQGDLYVGYLYGFLESYRTVLPVSGEKWKIYRAGMAAFEGIAPEYQIELKELYLTEGRNTGFR